MRSSGLGFCLPVILLTLSFAANAHDANAPTYDRISLSASAQEEVEADLLVAVLAAQREGTDAALLAGEVNGLVDWALSQPQGGGAGRVRDPWLHQRSRLHEG